MYSRYMRSGGLWEEPEKKPASVPPPAPVEKVLPPPPAPSVPRVEHTDAPRGISSLLKGLKLDTGDILLVVIIIFLLMESDDIEIVIALALLLLGGL